MNTKFPVIDIRATGMNIKTLLREKQISIAKLVKLLGFKQPTAIYVWLRGDGLPSIDNLVILSKILDVKIDDIIVTKEV